MHGSESIPNAPHSCSGDAPAWAQALIPRAILLAACLASSASAQSAPLPEERTLYISEYRVSGATKLSNPAIEEAVYPYLGPGRSESDIEQARVALEKAFQDNGYQTVSVNIPQQTGAGGVIYMEVSEGRVGRLRVKGSRYFLIDDIKKQVPSLAEGSVPNFNNVSREIVGLNQNPDRRVTPSLRPGAVPNTIDVDLAVEDTLPLHGNFELNNRYSANTTPLRLNGYLSYNNLWQLGHTLGFNFQIAPENIDDALIYGAYYIARTPEIPWLSLMVSGLRQNSNVSTLGGGAVAGNGEIVGARLIATLPPLDNLYHSLSAGLDYKHFGQDLLLQNGDAVGTPITYYPISIDYNAYIAGESYNTEITAGFVFATRGAGSSGEEFDNRRYNADGGFLYFRGELAHTQNLPAGFQVYGRLQGQLTGDSLVDSEQFAGGGLDTARGYLESEVLGDSGLFGTIEFISPSAPGVFGIDEWRAYAFTDAGFVTINNPLPEQQAQFNLASIGGGTRIRLFKVLNGSLDVGVPLISQIYTPVGDVRLTFRAWVNF